MAYYATLYREFTEARDLAASETEIDRIVGRDRLLILAKQAPPIIGNLARLELARSKAARQVA